MIEKNIFTAKVVTCTNADKPHKIKETNAFSSFTFL